MKKLEEAAVSHTLLVCILKSAAEAEVSHYQMKVAADGKEIATHTFK